MFNVQKIGFAVLTVIALNISNPSIVKANETTEITPQYVNNITSIFIKNASDNYATVDDYGNVTNWNEYYKFYANEYSKLTPEQLEYFTSYSLGLKKYQHNRADMINVLDQMLNAFDRDGGVHYNAAAFAMGVHMVKLGVIKQSELVEIIEPMFIRC